MQTKYLCVMIHICIKDEVGAVTSLSPRENILLTLLRGYFFYGSFMFFFCLVFALPLWASVYMCLVVTCWERAYLLALWLSFVVCHFPIGILGQVWSLIVSIPDL